MTARIIGLSGKKRSGKTSVYLLAKGALDEDETGKVIRISFADALKEMARAAYHWNGIKDEAGRTLLQRLGVHYRETVNENFWIDKWVRRVRQNRNSADIIFACDVRFPNEVAAIKALGGEVWRIVRPNNPFVGDTHISETALDDYDGWDAILVSDTLDGLLKQTMRLLKEK